MAFDPENKKITDAVKQIPSAPVTNKKIPQQMMYLPFQK